MMTPLLSKWLRTSPLLMNSEKIKTEEQIAVGFALRTNDELKHAVSKLEKKNLERDFTRKNFPLKLKQETVNDIINEIKTLMF